jgi:hypothetical protein
MTTSTISAITCCACHHYGTPHFSISFLPVTDRSDRRLYNASARAVKNVDPSLRVGGPASVGLGLLDEFMAGCESMDIEYDFVSSHSYPTDTWGNSKGGICPSYGYYWSPNCFTRNVVAASKKVPRSKQFYLTEYNVGCCEPNVYHDLPAAAAFVFWVLPKIAGFADVASYWTFSDIFVEDGWPTAEFVSHYGLETISGVAKPVRRAFELLHRYAGTQRFPVKVNTTDSPRNDVGTTCVVTNELGCFNQQASKDHCFDSRDGGGGFEWSANSRKRLSLATCLAYCAKYGAGDRGGAVSHIGLEAGKECWCSSHPPSANGSCPSIPAAECSLPCPGNASQSCGGPWRAEILAVTCPAVANNPPDPDDYLSVLATKDDAGGGVTLFLSTWDQRLEIKTDTPIPANSTGCPSGEDCVRSVSVNIPARVGATTATLYRIDPRNANPKASWEALGSPNGTLPASALAQIKAASVVPMATLQAPAAPDGNVRVQLKMEPNSAWVLKY